MNVELLFVDAAQANKVLSRAEVAMALDCSGSLGRSRPSGEGLGRSRSNREQKKEGAESSRPSTLVTRPHDLTTYDQCLTKVDLCEDLGRLGIGRSKLSRSELGRSNEGRSDKSLQRPTT